MPLYSDDLTLKWIKEFIMPKYDVQVQLSGNSGNAFAVIGSVIKALKQAGATEEEIKQYKSDAMSGDYDNLLCVSMEWVDCV